MPITEQQTTNRQHAIPQAIMSVEFKIIGDLTLKQFVYLLVFCGLAYASFMLVKPFIIKWSLVVICVGTGLAFAFLPLGDRGLDVWIVNFIKAMFAPNQYIYQKHEPIPSVFLYQNIDVVKNELITLTPTSSRRRIEEYLKQQEQKPDKLDINEREFILKVRQAYSQPPSFVKESVSPQKTYYTTPQQTQDQNTPSSYNQTNKEGALEETTSMSKAQEPKTTQDNIKDLTSNTQASLNQTQALVQSLQATTQTNQETNVETPQDLKIIKPSSFAYTKKAKIKPPHEYSPSITPDMRAGRIFINLSQEATKGEIVLPIRGERVIKTEEEIKLEETEKQKIESLNRILSEINKEKPQTSNQGEVNPKNQDATTNLLNLTNKETESLSLVSPINNKEESEKQKRKELEEYIQKTTESNAALQAEQTQIKQEQTNQTDDQQRSFNYALNEQDRLAKLRQNKIEKEVTEIISSKPPQKQTIPLTTAQIKEWPTIPNVVWGIVVKSQNGQDVGVGGVVVVIRNQKGEVVRAVKTSSLGRFGITTPLINGSYTIEVDREKKSGLNFPVMSLEAKGEIIPTIEIRAQA